MDSLQERLKEKGKQMKTLENRMAEEKKKHKTVQCRLQTSIDDKSAGIN